MCTIGIFTKWHQKKIITANFARDVVEKLPSSIETGVYFGWAKVDGDEVRKAVLSIGWNPHFENKEKSVVSNYC